MTIPLSRPATLAALLLSAAFCSTPAWAQTTVSAGWVRGTVAQQKATGAFMQIRSVQGGRLLSVSSPLAEVAEIHEMKMSGDVMKMAPVAGLDLPAGRAVELKPGGYHLMLMGLKQTLNDGDSVPMSLVVQSADGKKETVDLKLPVRGLGK